MDPPHLLLLGFLLLALAAPHPNTAMSTVGLAEGAEESSSGSTTVTVYRCKACESSICQARPISFEKFEKVAATKNRLFSNEVLELETTEKHIRVCFKQDNSFPEGIYGIVWEKARAAGRSCGILNSGENGRANISTEEKTICCKAKKNGWEPNSTLKCNAETRPAETKKPKDDILSEGILGDPEWSTSQMNRFGISFTVAFLGVLTGMAITYCYFRQRRGQAFRRERLGTVQENLHV